MKEEDNKKVVVKIVYDEFSYKYDRYVTHVALIEFTSVDEINSKYDSYDNRTILKDIYFFNV